MRLTSLDSFFLGLTAALLACSCANANGQDDYLYVEDLLEHKDVNHTWMEIGYVNLTDTEWTTITTTVTELNIDEDREMSVFLSLPEYGGPTNNDGWPMVAKMNGRATRLPNGAYTFQARLVQPNDSYCPQIWWTPDGSPTINVGWLIVEEGVYNITTSMLQFGSGEITRDNTVPLLKNDQPALYHAKYVMNFTTGCNILDPTEVCTFTEKVSDFESIQMPYGDRKNVTYSETGWSHLGATNQLQTSINKVPIAPNNDPSDVGKELWMNTRVRNVFPDRIVMMLAVHSVFVNYDQPDALKGPYNFNFTIFPDYADIHTPEIASYFVWEKNLRLACVEGLVMETKIDFPVTESALQMNYFYTYEEVPGLFGMIGTLLSVGDTTSLRVFDRSATGSKFITQEDQCTDEEQKHTTPEAAFSMIVGKAVDTIGDTRCFIAYDVKPCTYNIYLYDLFMDGWDNVDLVIDTGSEVIREKTQCGAKLITFTSITCSWNAHMETSDGKKPITWWENFWRYEHVERDGNTTVYVGDYDSTIAVKRFNVQYTDLVNTGVHSKDNRCEHCKVAPPPPKPGPGKGNGDGDGNTANGGVADLTAGNIIPSPPVGVGVAPDDVGAPEGILQITAVAGPNDPSLSPLTYTVFFALNVVDLTSTVQTAAFYRGSSSIVGPSFYSIDVTGFTTAFYTTGSFVVDETDIESWINGEIYIQVNTANHPSGEIRAQANLPSEWIETYLMYPSSGDAKKARPVPAPKPVPVLIELFDEESNGWYNNSGTWSRAMKVSKSKSKSLAQKKVAAPVYSQTMSLDTQAALFPDIIMYPRYVVMTKDRLKQLHVGSLCPHRGIERCEERLPPHGEFIFRVIGKDPEGDYSWKFCGVTGTVGEELQFAMKKGKCQPVSLTNAWTFCTMNTVLSVRGSILLRGVTSELTEVDTKVLENEISSMLVSTTYLAIDSWEVGEKGTTVIFDATLVTEKQGVDGRLSENLDALVSTLSTNIRTSLSSGSFMTLVSSALSDFPATSLSITHTIDATLTSFEITNVQYVEASSNINERTPSIIPRYTHSDEESVASVDSSEESSSSMIVTACAIVSIVVIVAALALRARQPYSDHEVLAVDSEHVLDNIHVDTIPEFDLGLDHAAPKNRFFVSKERF